MPRDFDSDQARTREPGVMLSFTEIVDCPLCHTLFDGLFHDLGVDGAGSDTVEDIVDPPAGEHRCPSCQHHWTSEISGWSFYSEAG